MKKNKYPLVVKVTVFILVMLLLAWWVTGKCIKPYPPPTPTNTVFISTATTTIAPSATPTKVVRTPVQPTIGYTKTPTILPETATPIPEPTATPTPEPTRTLRYYQIAENDNDCIVCFIRPWGIKILYRCIDIKWR